jgi:hypothetical protein
MISTLPRGAMFVRSILARAGAGYLLLTVRT